MPISDVLLHVDYAASFETRAAATVVFARAHDAHIIGLGAKAPIPPVFVGDGGGYPVMAELEALRERDLAADAERFATTMQAAGFKARSEWRSADGDPVGALAFHARYADLTVVSQGDPAKDDSLTLELPGDLALASGRPVLVIPYVGAQASIGRKVLIGWNATRESARAVADAMAILETAEEVVVATVSERGIRETAGQDLARWLTRHAIRAEVVAVAAGGIGAGEALLNIAMEQGADLLVMGCYGHSRLREAILGGASRTLLRSMTIPVLMSH